MKNLALYTLIGLFSFFIYAEELTHEQFAGHVVSFLGKENEISKNLYPQSYFDYLTACGVEPRGGFKQGKIMDIEESISLFNFAISQNKTLKDSIMTKIDQKIRNKVIIVKIIGDVFVQQVENGKWERVIEKARFTAGNKIKTGKDSSVYLRIGTLGNVVLKSDSVLDISKMTVKKDGKNEDIHLHLSKGNALVNVQGMSKKSSFKTSTPSTVVAVRGTIYELSAT